MLRLEGQGGPGHRELAQHRPRYRPGVCPRGRGGGGSDEAEGKGRIITVSSEAGSFPAQRMTTYCVSKAGVTMLMKCMALEPAQFGIRVNASAPGLTRTNINRNDLGDETFPKARLARIPLGRVMAPEDLVGPRFSWPRPTRT